MGDDVVTHWTDVYTRDDPENVSWYQPEPKRSLALIESTGLPHSAAILDVGAGSSTLAERLIANGYTDVTVADISRAALAHAQAHAAGVANRITWIEADIRSHQFPRRYQLWHDRATFHFMVTPPDRDAYLNVLKRTLQPNGHLILATFAPDGPQQCSGLPVLRYDAPSLAALLGSEFTLIRSDPETHQTPSGTNQQFTYTHFVRTPSSLVDDPGLGSS